VFELEEVAPLRQQPAPDGIVAVKNKQFYVRFSASDGNR
jgi:hypothetical protein